jgi:MFS family permease
MNQAVLSIKNQGSERLRHRIAISVFFFAKGFTFASWASRIPHIQAKLQLGEAALGTILFALPAGLMISLLISGGLITRLGSKKTLLFAALCYSTILVLLGTAQNAFQLAAGLFLFGFAGNLYNISVNSQAVMVEKLYGRSIMASFHGTWSLAGFTGAAVGLIIVSLGLLPWQHFVIAGLAGIILAIIFSSGTIQSVGEKKQTGFTLPDKKILQLGFIAFGCLVCEGTMFDWSGVYFKKVVHAPANLTTLGYAAFMGCMAAGRFLADKAVMLIGPRRLLQHSGILITLGFLLSVSIPSVPMATIGFMLVGFGVSSVVPIVYSLAGKNAKMNTGQAIAAVSTVGFVGFLAGPPIIGFVAAATSLRWSFALIGLIGLTTTLLASTLPKPDPQKQD